MPIAVEKQIPSRHNLLLITCVCYHYRYHEYDWNTDHVL